MLKAYEITPEQANKLNPNWTWELKYDGFRSFWTGKKIISDRGIDVTYKFKHIADTLNSFSDNFLDMEIFIRGGCVHDISKKTNWGKAVSVVLDILKKNSENITSYPLKNRRVVRKEFFDEMKPDKNIIEPMVFNSFREGWEYIKRNGLEGIMAKDLNSTHHPNIDDILKVFRVHTWYKIKDWKEDCIEIFGHNAGSVKGSFTLANGGRISANSRKMVDQYYAMKDKGRVFCEFYYLYKTHLGNYFQPRIKRLISGETHNQNTNGGEVIIPSEKKNLFNTKGLF